MIDEGILAAIRTRLTAALAAPPRRYVALRQGSETFGWTNAERAARLERFTDVFTRSGEDLAMARGLRTPEARTAALAEVVQALAAEGLLTAWRDERYPVASTHGAPPLFELERAAARYFGVLTFAAHVNGLVAHFGELGMWLARRSRMKPIDPGMLDNLVAGGIRVATTVAETVRREAWEEAGITSSVVARAVPVGLVRICREQPDGLQREVIFVHDLRLPSDYTPTGVDGEAIEHRIASLSEAGALIAANEGPDVVTADASLVILDCLFRHGAISPESPHCVALSALRSPALVPAGGTGAS